MDRQTIIRRFDVPGPRYTSYPTADRFGTGFGPAQALQALQARATDPAPLSLYVHVPFCESVCYYCACNKVVTRQHRLADAYLGALEAEIGLVTAALGRGHAAVQLHLGGGTPTFLSDAELARLMAALRGAFDLRPGAELSIEIDPRTVTPERLRVLAGLGFNRLSFGVQDFDAAVQEAVHRVQPFEAVRALMAAARGIGFGSINVDLIYGLPRQTAESFARTIAQIGALRPDRIALYAYAHLPERFKPQRRIAAADLPDAALRLAMQEGAVAGLAAHGYTYIGMDHFALPGDALAVAQREGRLQRNFQGYSTQADCDIVAFGVSAIGRVGHTYGQNAKTLLEYYAALEAGRLPVERGIALSADDERRRALIMALMCHGRAPFDDEDRGYYADELQRLAPLVDAGLVALERHTLQVTAAGRSVLRAIAMVFDRHLRHDPGAQTRFSRVV